MISPPGLRLRSAVAFGAVLGVLVLLFAALMLSEDSPWNVADGSGAYTSDLAAFRQGLFWKSALITGAAGGLSGAVIATAVWVTRSPHSVSRLWLVAAWWLLGAVAGLAAAVGFLQLPFMASHLNVGRDGSGGPGVGFLILIVGLTGLALGSFSGIAIGLWSARYKCGCP